MKQINPRIILVDFLGMEYIEMLPKINITARQAALKTNDVTAKQPSAMVKALMHIF